MTWIHAEHTDVANIDDITLWSSESDSGEVESKGDFEEHHCARGKSKRSKRVQMDDAGERAGDAGKRIETAEAALYSRF